MSNLDKLKRYLENSISKIKEENKKIELQKRYKQIADTIIEQLNNGEYLAINISGLAELFDFIYNTTTSNELKKFEEAVQLSEFFEMEEIVQITKAKEYLEDLKESLKKYSSSFEMSIYKARRHLSGNLKKYEEYLSLFNDNGIQVHLDGPELNEFFEFLKNSSLEKQLVYELIVEFSKDSIEYYTGLKKLKTKKEASIVTKNSKRVAQTIKKSIVRPTVVETKLETPTETVYYTEAEKEIIGKIKEIIETLERDNNQSVDYALSELLIGDYELSTREKIFSSSNNVWNTILNDLKENLIPNIEKDKQKIIEIFEYIIKKYETEYKVKQEKEQTKPFVSNVQDFTEEERQMIESFVRLADFELNIYNNMSEAEKNTIYSIEQLMKESDIATLNELNADYSQCYVECLGYFKKLQEKYNDYNEWRKGEEEFAKDGLQAECDAFLINLMAEIRNIVKNLEPNYNLLIQERHEEAHLENIADTFDYQQPKKNLIIFLPSQEGEYYITGEQSAIMSTAKDVMKDVSCIVKQIYALDFEEYRKMLNSRNRKIKCNKNKIEEELNPHRIRRSNARIAYITLPVTQNNKKVLKGKLNLSDNFRVLLFIGADKKITSDDDAYRYFNSQMELELNKIRQIKNCFGSDFTTETYPFVEKLIDDSVYMCDRLIENPYKSISPTGPGSSGRGGI